MSVSHKPIRILQIISGIAILASVTLMLDYFDVITLPRFSDFTGTRPVATTPKKIKRPTISRSASVQELLDQGAQLMFDRQYEDAIAAYKAAAEKSPKDATIYEKIGDAYFSQRKHDLAHAQYEIAQKLSPTSETLLIKRVRTLIGQRKPLQARQLLDANTSPSAPVTFYKGLLAAFYNDRDAAQKLFAMVIESGNNQLLQTKSQLFLNLYKEFDVAEEAPLTYLQVQLALAFNHVGEYGLAIDLAFNAVKNDSVYRDAYLVLGHSFLNEYRWFDAEDAFSKVISLDSTSGAGYFFRGVSRRELNKPREAISDFSQAIQNGYRPKIAVEDELASLYYSLGDLPHAYEYYKHIVETDPTEIKRFIRPMALAINQLKKPLEAKALAERALKAHPNTAMSHNLIGWAHMANGELAEARASFDQARTLDPELPALSYNIGQLEERIGAVDKARAAYLKAVEYGKKYNDPGIAYDAQTKFDALANATATNNAGTSVLSTGAIGTSTPLPPQIVPSLSLE
ncbi:tetratricopeptide repeat protein [Candidatus Gracilibacteria bacterium]|nr:tetratricopeptide repeat protein [Candidatus Gracilibacteria bacterium]